MPASKEEVDTFLKKFKKYWPPDCYVVPSDINDEGLFYIGIVVERRKREILSLSFKDYYKGPEPDDSGTSSDIWIFKKTIRKVKVYIKLKTYKTMGKTYAKCLSFHQ